MSSTAQVLANQINAQLSTGPRTAEGKAVSSTNSYRHGVYATRLLFSSPQEEQDFAELHAAFIEMHHPKTAQEEKCIHDMARAQWLLNDAAVEEAQFTARLRDRLTEEIRSEGLDPDHHLAARVLEARASNKTLIFSGRRLRHLHTTYYRALRYLLQFQKERRKLIAAQDAMEFRSFLDGMDQDIRAGINEAANELGFVSSPTPPPPPVKKNSLPPKARRWR